VGCFPKNATFGRKLSNSGAPYRGLKKDTGQIVTLFALANLWLMRNRLLPLVGEVRP
jgi:hypothetical protein